MIRAIDTLVRAQEARMAWLIRAGTIAKQLNEQSRKEAENGK